VVVEVVVAEGSLKSGASTVGSRSEEARAEADDQARESIVEIPSVQVSRSVYFPSRGTSFPTRESSREYGPC